MSYEFTKLSEVPAVSEFPEGANAIIETNGEIKRCPSAGGSSVPKPLTYDYMPEGYPTKSVSFDIEWDGNTDGLTSAIYNSNIRFYKVSDIVPTNDDLSGGTFNVSGGNEVIHITSDMIITPSEDLRMVSEYIIIVQKENATLGDALFPQTGTYFYKGMTTGDYITRLSKQTITPMSEEFLPNIPADKLPTIANSTTVFYL